jgi:glycosyltransferase involved in cell wall biosynthesis
MMLYRLLQAPALEHYSHRVVSLTDLGVMAERLRRLGIPSQALEMSRFPNPLKILRLARIIRVLRPAVVQAWMYHANLIGGIAARLTGDVRVVWGIHSCVLEPQRTRLTTRWTVALCARLSHWLSDRIVAVSRTSRDQHVANGYDAGRFVVIPNGFDLDQYRPDPDCRREARGELGVDSESVLIGLVARMHPVKDHLNFVTAAALLARRQPNVRFLLCGEGTAADESLVRAIGDAGLSGRFLLLGRRDDVPRIMSSLDVATLCSAAGEAFPLAVGEAMACGVPCVVTDVGDCAYLVGETGRVVPPRDPEALARAWEDLVRLGTEGRRHLGLQARQRIEAHFSLPQTAEEYAAVYRDVLGSSAADQLVSARAH